MAFTKLLFYLLLKLIIHFAVLSSHVLSMLSIHVSSICWKCGPNHILNKMAHSTLMFVRHPHSSASLHLYMLCYPVWSRPHGYKRCLCVCFSSSWVLKYVPPPMISGACLFTCLFTFIMSLVCFLTSCFLPVEYFKFFIYFVYSF